MSIRRVICSDEIYHRHIILRTHSLNDLKNIVKENFKVRSKDNKILYNYPIQIVVFFFLQVRQVNDTESRERKKKKAFNLSRYITIAPHPYEYVWDNNNIEYNVVDPLLNNHKQNS